SIIYSVYLETKHTSPDSSLFHYTTLFRSTFLSGGHNSIFTWRQAPQGVTGSGVSATTARATNRRFPSEIALNRAVRSAQLVSPRSEEHTSELQSRENLV